MRAMKVAGKSRGRIAAAVLLLPLLVAGCGDGGGEAAKKQPAATASPVSTPAVVAATNLDDAGATRVDILGDWLAAGEGGIWLSGDAAVYRLGPPPRRPTAPTPPP